MQYEYNNPPAEMKETRILDECFLILLLETHCPRKLHLIQCIIWLSSPEWGVFWKEIGEALRGNGSPGAGLRKSGLEFMLHERLYEGSDVFVWSITSFNMRLREKAQSSYLSKGWVHKALYTKWYISGSSKSFTETLLSLFRVKSGQ